MTTLRRGRPSLFVDVTLWPIPIKTAERSAGALGADFRWRAAARFRRHPRPLSGPQDAQDDDPSLVIKDEVDHHFLAALPEEGRAHVPVGPLTIVSPTAPWRGFEDGHELGVMGKRLRRQRRDLVQSVLLRFDRIHLQAQPGLRRLPGLGSDIAARVEFVRAGQHVSVRL